MRTTIDHTREHLIAAAELVISTQFVSTSMLQRKMRVSLTRAMELLDALERRGIVSAFLERGRRDVLVPAAQLQDTLERLRTQDDHVAARYYADRVLNAQHVSRGVHQPDGTHAPIPAELVAAVLHALADHTHNSHMLAVAKDHLLARPDDTWPAIDSLGRYFHALADSIDTRLAYVVCNRLLDPEENEHCEFDGRVILTDAGAGTCPACRGPVRAEDER
ncbi:hypothetical protein CH252_19000 [Rhodococcus sp. 06-1477-1B]|nr:hypothetical protein CH252_19000 [Rhodococcus sp. 06-1477-1B]